MNIPSHATRVFKGVLFEIYQWEQELFDGSRKTFEAVKTKDGIKVLATHNNKILVCKEEQPSHGSFYSLFGGYIEDGEHPLEAAKRELLEESGMESNDWELLKIHEPRTSYGWKMHLYLARNCTKISDPKLEAGERIEVKHLDFSDFLSLLDSPELRNKDLLLDFIKYKYQQGEAEEFKNRLFQKIAF